MHRNLDAMPAATWAGESLGATRSKAAIRSIRIKRGLDVPIGGLPRQEICEGSVVDTVALVGPDYVGLKPTLAVQPGERVKAGQVIFVDKKTRGVKYTSPASGRVLAIHRGEKRALESVVIEVIGEAAQTFSHHAANSLERLPVELVRAQLVDSGLWTALRTRPFGKVPSPQSTPHSVFVTAIDTHPLAARPETIIAQRPDNFADGLRVLARLGGQTVFLCKAVATVTAGVDLPGVTTVEFAGPHPAGLPGTHIHFLDPVGRHKTVWHINYQDVIAVGHLFRTGRLDFERVISLAGPGAREPRLLRTRLGANLDDLTRGELVSGSHRVISGSILAGRTAGGTLGFLGRYHLQVSILPEAGRREFFGWLWPGFARFSNKRVMAANLLRRRTCRFDTSTNGSRRAIFPIGSFERVMPLDILPTFLLRALEVDDLEQAEALGCLELDEEDLALCEFVCPGKGDYATMLRRNLTAIEREG